MKPRALLLFAVFFVASGLAWLSSGVQAAPPAQGGYSTPTPGEDGRIIYVVQASDSCLRISLLTGVSVDDIIRNNHLDDACTIQVGQRLVIGISEPSVASPTLGPSPVPTEAAVSATPETSGTAIVCVALYDDMNGDGLRQANTDINNNYIPAGTEPTIGGGAVSLNNADGSYSKTLDTVLGYNPVCFNDVPKGDYTVSAAVPEGFNATTLLNFPLPVFPGDVSQVAFGVQKTSLAPQPGESRPSTSPLLGIGGALFILGGIGLAVFAFRMRKAQK